jgi:hypothetical protein
MLRSELKCIRKLRGGAQLVPSLSILQDCTSFISLDSDQPTPSFTRLVPTTTSAHFLAPLATSTSARFSSPSSLSDNHPRSFLRSSLRCHHGSPISPYPFSYRDNSIQLSYRDHSIHRSRVFPSSWRKLPGRAVQYHYEPFLGRILHVSDPFRMVH